MSRLATRRTMARTMASRGLIGPPVGQSGSSAARPYTWPPHVSAPALSWPRAPGRSPVGAPRVPHHPPVRVEVREDHHGVAIAPGAREAWPTHRGVPHVKVDDAARLEGREGVRPRFPVLGRPRTRYSPGTTPPWRPRSPCPPIGPRCRTASWTRWRSCPRPRQGPWQWRPSDNWSWRRADPSRWVTKAGRRTGA